MRHSLLIEVVNWCVVQTPEVKGACVIVAQTGQSINPTCPPLLTLDDSEDESLLTDELESLDADDDDGLDDSELADDTDELELLLWLETLDAELGLDDDELL
jgi:hypothetical protein